MTTTAPEVQIETASHLLDSYLPVVGAAQIDELRALAHPMEGSEVEMVNSTAVGGGVAEILMRLMPLLREVGLDAHWRVMEGDLPFFEVTKGFHNALHGEAYHASPRDFEIFRECDWQGSGGKQANRRLGSRNSAQNTPSRMQPILMAVR